MTDPRLMLVHAHPDDESSQSAATMARYVAEGAKVTLVTCTLGERGEILVPDWEHFTPAELGEQRSTEIGAALAELGVSDHVWLGGRGRFHDTGMTRSEDGQVGVPEDAPDNCFWKADLLEAADHLVELIRDRRPHVIATYDPFGGYGHPDHIQAHRVTMYALTLAASTAHRQDLGQAWQVPRVLWSVFDSKNWEEAFRLAAEQGIHPFGEENDTPPARPASPVIDVRVPIGPWVGAAEAALKAHRSQVRLDDDFWRLFQIMRGLPQAGEAYHQVWGPDFAEPGVASDLFSGLKPRD